MTDKQLPAPPLPASVNLRVLDYMPLHVSRLRDSETALKTRPEAFRCAVLLWCACWHQVPAASLPDDDQVLADLAGFGRAEKEWKRVKEGALRGFVKCSDGRLYHTVVAQVAVTSWVSMLKGRWEREKGRLKKEHQRTKKPVDIPEFEQWITRECPEALPYLSRDRRGHVPEDTTPTSPGQPSHVPRERGSKRSEGISIPAVTSTSTGTSEARANAPPHERNSKSKQEASTHGPSSGVPRHVMDSLPKNLRDGIEAKRREGDES